MIELPYWIRVGRDSKNPNCYCYYPHGTCAFCIEDKAINDSVPCQNCEKPGCWFKCLENDNYTQEQINHANIYTYNVLQQEINRKVRYF